MEGSVTAREFDLLAATLASRLDDLARAVSDGAEQSSREHAEVRAELRDLRRQLDTGVASIGELRQLKSYVYAVRDEHVSRLDALEADRDERRGSQRARLSMWRIALGAAALAASVATVVALFLGG